MRREGDVHDLPSPRLLSRPAHHRPGCHRVGHQPGALDVEAHDRPEALGRDVLRRREELATGVVHEQVDAPVTLEGPVHEGMNVLLLADVTDARLDAGALGTLCGLRQRLLAPAAHHHARTEGGQLERGGAPESGPAAADDRHLALQQAGLEDPGRHP